LLVEGISDYAIYLLGSEGVISSWNQERSGSRGYREREVIGSHCQRNK
jgi:hypothetical protein